MTSIQEAKQDLRRKMKNRFKKEGRFLADRTYAAQCAMLLHQHLSAVPEFSTATALAAFIDFQNEIKIRQIFNYFFEPPCQTVAVPRCVGDNLFFYRIEQKDVRFDKAKYETFFPTLKKNSYGILEPIVDPACPNVNRVDPQDFDVVLVPGLAFDRAGRRLGRGKGYYDRFLAQTKPSAVRVAVAFDFQIVPKIPTDENDQLVHYIATPTQLVRTDAPHPKRHAFLKRFFN